MKEKKLIAILMIIMVTFVFSVVPVSAASKKVKLSKTKITLQVKASKKLKITGTKKKVKWSVSKKLVTIKTKGKKKHTAVIKAGKKAGTCWVIAKVGKKKYKCKVVIKKKKKDEGHGSVSPQEEPFVEKPLSGTSTNITEKYKAQAIEALAADDSFKAAVANTSVRLLQETAKKKPAKNLLISPDSILTAMAMCELGAKNETLSEMETAFGIEAEKYSRYLSTMNKRLTNSKSISYDIADSIWYRNDELTIKPEFLQKNVNYHQSEIYEAPFSNDTVNDINNWVYNHTKGMIPSIVDDLEEAKVALVNAIAFEGNWAEPYDKAVKETFTLESGTAKSVDMLIRPEKTYLKVGSGQGFVKPYAGGQIAFMGILPPKGTSVDDFVAGLSGNDLVNAYANRQTENIIVDAWIPKFNYDYDASLENVMQELGIRKAFTDSADFSGMTDYPICIDRILHKTHIEVTEQGTKAAAATAVIGKAGAAPGPTPKKYEVHLDRPFVYAIIDTETGLPLFLGYVKEI